MQLFVERARQVQPNFSLDEDAESVITICQLTEGMPLGLELAATWLRVMSCHQIAAQMDRSLDFLTTPLRNIPQRHRSLRAVFEHSWSLLSDIERNALADLSVFRGGFDQEAAEYVAGASLPILAGLVDKSLIRLRPSSRYDLHELLRQFAADKLAESGETAAVTERHLAFFSKLADEAEAHLYGPHQEAWFDRLELEHDNLGAALVWTLKEEKSEAGLRLAGGLGWFWELRSHFHEGYIWLERLLAIHSSAPTLVRVKALQFAGVCASNLGDNQHARKFCEESLALACETGDKRRIAWALGTLGLYVELTNNLNRAISHLEEALALFRTIGDAWGISHMLRRLGWMLTSYGDYEQARILLEEVLTLAREAADKNATAWALFILGNAVWLQSNGTSHRQAMTLCEESLSLAREIHDKNLLAGVLVTLGRVARTQGDYQTAQTYFKDSLVVYGEMQGRSIWTAQVLALFAGLAHTQGKLEKAARLFGAIDNFLQEYFVPFGIKASFDLDVVAVRTQLGEEAFVSAWAEGQAMTTEQAIAYALDQED